jgi:glycosyltransferase involved in cell wall biosynthesis
VTRATIVVACHNEERRLPVAAFEAFVPAHPDVGFVLVNDGSEDGTGAALRALERLAPERVCVVDLPRNVGKAEAIRRGLARAFALEPAYAGFWDADLATPLEAIPEFCALLDTHPRIEMVFGSRVQLLGRRIRRRAWRHYLGRVAATAISLALDLRVYDTQCGAKLFRATPAIRALFDEPFASRWLFDVEIVARLIAARRGRAVPQAADVIYELPLMQWEDVGGSKIGPWDYLQGAVDLVRIHRRYLRNVLPASR